MIETQNLLIELDQLKSVYRRAYISDGSRNENSAEHSWHLAVALLALKEIIPKERVQTQKVEKDLAVPKQL